MGVPLNLKDIQSGFLTASAFNENNTLIEEALAKALNRTSNATDNAMEVDLDMGLNKVFNAKEALNGHELTTLSQVQKLILSASSDLVARFRETRKVASEDQTVFNLSDIAYTPGSNNIMVYVNGVAQVAGIDYAETDSTTITFLSGLSAGDFVDIYVNESTTSVEDTLLRQQLLSSDVGQGASLINTESGTSVQETLDTLANSNESPLYELGLTVAATSNTGLDYHSEPRVVQISDGTLVMVHQRSDDHDTNENILVSRRSTDLGETWSEPTVVYDPVSGFAGRNPSIGYSEEDNRIIVFAREYNSSITDQTDLVYLTSTDGGITWSAPTSVFSQFSDTTRVAPFGRTVKTSNGLMQTFYTGDKAWVLFSTDNGQTWGNRVTAYDLVQVSATFVEPFVVAIDDTRLIMVIRDEESKNKFWIGKSDDGGLTWPGGREQAIYSSETIDQATPACMALVGTDIYCAWAARAQDYKLYLTRVNKEFFWKEPTYGFNPTLGEPVRRLWKSNIEGGVATGAEYGYPDITPIAGKQGSALISWYDSEDGTNGTDTVIYCQSTGLS